ncbi:hypothetical protein WS68_18845 [Burkholderia sp. TSV86]|nr:hypothetical protein WS68_18845 [Burkholderia sp. TSV86]
MPRADIHLLALMRQNLARLGLTNTRKAHEASLVERVAAVIRLRIADGEPSLDDMAEALNMPSRTLQRRLRTYGYTYQEILLAVRREVALDYLCNPDVQISELALLLGYSEISAFSRAFHRWFDTSPSEWRRGYLKAQGISQE